MGTHLSLLFFTKQSLEFRISPSKLNFLSEGKSSNVFSNLHVCLLHHLTNFKPSCATFRFFSLFLSLKLKPDTPFCASISCFNMQPDSLDPENLQIIFSITSFLGELGVFGMVLRPSALVTKLYQIQGLIQCFPLILGLSLLCGLAIFNPTFIPKNCGCTPGLEVVQPSMGGKLAPKFSIQSSPKCDFRLVPVKFRGHSTEIWVHQVNPDSLILIVEILIFLSSLLSLLLLSNMSLISCQTHFSINQPHQSILQPSSDPILFKLILNRTLKPPISDSLQRYLNSKISSLINHVSPRDTPEYPKACIIGYPLGLPPNSHSLWYFVTTQSTTSFIKIIIAVDCAANKYIKYFKSYLYSERGDFCWISIIIQSQLYTIIL
ncbi:hypothetical protein VP01_930g3 [Puccinia sorghi]|uniref:Uncharacterized protein n=1 Tax=Puccinia sorghi TaxID=27349 RepID=A0A0L6U7F9_9BASI|nr:hypothetical protein VP01_930g3 [Puccinia sorghi]